MNSLKDNPFVKWTYAYVDLIYKILPLLFLILLLPAILGKTLLFHSGSSSNDFFGLFWNNAVREQTENKYIISPTIVLLANLFYISMIYLALIKLTKFLKNVFNDNPFIEENGKHLKYIGAIIIVATLFSYSIKIITHPVETSSVITLTTKMLIYIASFMSVVFNPYIFLGLLVIVIGEIILHGYKLKEENDLTV